MILPVIIYSTIAIGFAILQSILPVSISLFGAIPDIAFIVIVHFAFMNGVMSGQIVGFVSGIFFDFMSLAPFGFNAFVRSLTGHIIGRFKGVIHLDAIFLPMALVGLSYVLKFVISMLLGLVLGVDNILSRLFSIQTLVELLLTIVVTPLIFWPLRLIRDLLSQRRAYR